MKEVILIVMLFLEGGGTKQGPSVSVHTTKFSNLSTCEIVADRMQTKYRNLADWESKSNNHDRRTALSLRGVLFTECVAIDK